MNNQSVGTIKKRVALSTAAQVLGQLISAAVGVIVLKVLTRHLGVQGYGLYATAIAFVTTFSLLTDLGLNAITAREIAKNPKKADQIIGYNMGLRLSLCLIMIPIISGLGFVIYGSQSPTLPIAIFLLTFYLLFDAIRTVAMGYFSAKIRNDITAAVNTSQQILMLALIVVGVAVSWGIYGFIVAYVVGNVLAAILAIIVTRKHVAIKPRASLKEWKLILTLSLSIGVIQIVNMLYLKADTILISTIKGPAEAGIYGVAYSLILAIMTIPSFVMSALIPAMATAKKELRPIVEKAYHYIMILAVLLPVGAFLVRKDVIITISGAEFSSAAIPFVVLALASAFSYVNAVIGFASVSLNKHGKLIYVSVGSLVINIGLNLILIPKYSIKGASAATVVSEVLGLLAAYAIFRRETGIQIKKSVDTLKALFAGLTTVVSLSYLYSFIATANHLINLITVTMLTVVVYSLLLLVVRGLPSEIYHLPFLERFQKRT